MRIHGLPKEFWVVTRPTPASVLEDILFQCTFGGLMRQALGGLTEDEIVGVYADEDKAKEAAAKLLGERGGGGRLRRT
jgi:hypothetical protein